MKLTENAEDILEAIFSISQHKSVVRVKDIAKKLDTTNASVTVALKSLVQKGLVSHEHYGYVELTDKGRKIAEKIYKRHKLLYEFFHNTLALPPKIAEKDACRIEHYLSKEGLERILKFVEFIKKCPESSPVWLTNFYYFLEHKTHPASCLEKQKELKTIYDMKKDEEAVIVRISGSVSTKQNLIRRELVPGANVKLIGKKKEKIIIQVGKRKENISPALSKHVHVSLT